MQLEKLSFLEIRNTFYNNGPVVGLMVGSIGPDSLEIMSLIPDSGYESLPFLFDTI